MYRILSKALPHILIHKVVYINVYITHTQPCMHACTHTYTYIQILRSYITTLSWLASYGYVYSGKFRGAMGIAPSLKLKVIEKKTPCIDIKKH